MTDVAKGTDIPHVHGANEKGRDARAPVSKKSAPDTTDREPAQARSSFAQFRALKKRGTPIYGMA